MTVDNAVHFTDPDGDTLRVNAIGEKVVFTTIAKGQHVDDGLGVTLTRADLRKLNLFLIEVEGE